MMFRCVLDVLSLRLINQHDEHSNLIHVPQSVVRGQALSASFWLGYTPRQSMQSALTLRRTQAACFACGKFSCFDLKNWIDTF